MAPAKRRNRSLLTRKALLFPPPREFSPLLSRTLDGIGDATTEPASEAFLRTSCGPFDTPATLDTQWATGTVSTSEPSDISTERTGFATDIEVEERPFASRRDFMCYGYLDGSARASTRQYDMMREVENSFSPAEAWPTRSRLQQLMIKLMESAAAMKKITTARHLPIGKGRAQRRLADASMQYIPFFKHIRRYFVDAASARMLHDKGDSDVGSVDSPSDIFQTLVATDPSSKNSRAGCRF